MTEYTVKFSADFGYAEEKIDAETPDHALEKARAMPQEALLFERYDGVGDILEIEVFEDEENIAAYWLSREMCLRLAAREMLAALEAMVAVFDHVGLRGLVYNAKKHGWTRQHVDTMSSVCLQAKVAIALAKATKEG